MLKIKTSCLAILINGPLFPCMMLKKKKSFKLRFNLVIQEIKAYIIHVFFNDGFHFLKHTAKLKRTRCSFYTKFPYIKSILNTFHITLKKY